MDFRYTYKFRNRIKTGSLPTYYFCLHECMLGVIVLFSSFFSFLMYHVEHTATQYKGGHPPTCLVHTPQKCELILIESSRRYTLQTLVLNKGRNFKMNG